MSRKKKKPGRIRRYFRGEMGFQGPAGPMGMAGKCEHHEDVQELLHRVDALERGYKELKHEVLK